MTTWLNPFPILQPPALNQVYSLDLKTAHLLADSAKQACKQLNQNIAVVVVDRGGNTLTAERHELVGLFLY